MSFSGSLQKLGLIPDGAGGMRFLGHVTANGGFSGALGRGKVFFVDALNGSDSADGRSPKTPLLTLAAAEAKTVTNRHDTVVLIGGTSAFSIVDQLVWDKSYTHLIGVAAPSANPRARILSSGATTTTLALLKVTGTGCIFSNFKISQESDMAACHAIEVTGGRNFFENVEINGQVHATSAGGASYSLFINGGEENRFFQCTIGTDTIVRTAGAALRLDSQAVRNEFIECFFRSASETAALPLVTFADTLADDRYTLFRRCLFYNFSVNHAVTLNEVFIIPAGMSTHDLLLQDCAARGFTQWASGDRGNIWVSGPAAAAGSTGVGSSGIMVQPT